MRLSRKEWLRQLGQEAVEDAEDFGDVQIRRLPTIYKLRCACGHYASIAVPRDRTPRFRCRLCGSTNVQRVI